MGYDRSMAATVIPLEDVPAQRLSIALGGQLVRLSVRWQASSETWTASLEHPPATPIVTGRRIALDEPLLGSAPSAFTGELWCRAIEGEEEPGLHAWGNTHRLEYLP